MAHEILLNSGDSIDEADLQTAFAAMGKGYIEQDALDIQYFDSDDTIDTTPALARVPDNNRDIPLYVDAITGYSLEANAVNNVWLVVDPAAATDDEAVDLQHNTTGVEPSNPSLLIAEVDTNQSGSGAVSLRNRGTAPTLEGADMNPATIGRSTPAADIATQQLTVGDGPPTTTLADWHRVLPSDDLDAAIESHERIVLAPGTHALANTHEITEGQVIDGANRATIAPTADQALFRIIGDETRDRAQVRNLEIDVGANVGAYSASAIEFPPSSIRGTIPSVKDVTIIATGGAGMGNGGSGITWLSGPFQESGGGVGDTTVRGVRVMFLDHAFEMDAREGGYCNAHRIESSQALNCAYGVRERRGDSGTISGNYYNLYIQFHSNFEWGYWIEGDQSTIEDLSFDDHNAQQRSMHVEGVDHQVIEREGRADLNDRAELNARRLNLVDSRSVTREYALGVADAPRWAVTAGDGVMNWEYAPEVAVQLAAADGTHTVTSSVPKWPARESPDIEAWYRLEHGADIRTEFGLRDNDGRRIAIMADPENQSGAGITGNFIFVVDDEDDGTQYYDTGVSIVTNWRRMLVRMLDRGTTAHAIIGTTRVASHTTDSGFTPLHPHSEVQSLIPDNNRRIRLAEPFITRHSTYVP